MGICAVSVFNILASEIRADIGALKIFGLSALSAPLFNIFDFCSMIKSVGSQWARRRSIVGCANRNRGGLSAIGSVCFAGHDVDVRGHEIHGVATVLEAGVLCRY